MKRNSLYKQIMALVLVISIIAPTALTFAPERAEAQIPVAGGLPVVDVWNVAKETLDGIQFTVINLIIQQITAQTINWINSGFKGNPAYITDVSGFFGDLADQIAGQFLQGSQLSFLCQPFQLSVRLAIARSRINRQQAQCTLSKVVKNIQAFTAGDFSQGGWPGFLTLTTTDYGNSLNSYITSQSLLQAQIANVSFSKSLELNWSKGFLSVKDPSCDENVVGIGRCPTVTPGAVIETQLNNQLDSSNRRLIVAKEFNEVLNALFTQLIVQVLTSANGLFGLSSNGSGGSSYTDQLINQQTQSSSFTVYGDLSQAINIETAYQSFKTDSFSILSHSQSLLRGVQACYQSKINGGTLSAANTAIAQDRITSASSTIDSIITPRLLGLQDDLAAADQALGELDVIQADLQQTGNTTRAANDLNDLSQSGILHSSFEAVDAQSENTGLRNQFMQIDQATAQKQTECQNFP